MPFSASIDDDVAVLDKTDRSADRGLRPDMADAKPARAAREAPVGDERNLVAGALAVKRRRRRQHLAHAGAALRALVADDDDVAVLVLARFDGAERIFLAIEATRRDRGISASSGPRL